MPVSSPRRNSPPRKSSSWAFDPKTAKKGTRHGFPFPYPCRSPTYGRRPPARRAAPANAVRRRRCAAPPGLRPSPQGKPAKAAGYGPQGKPSCGRFRRPPAAGSGFAGAPSGRRLRLRRSALRPPAPASPERPPAAGSGFAGAPCGPPSADKARGMGRPPLASPIQKAGSPLQDCRPSAVPSLDKSTYGFCGQKCRMALCGSSTGASLPSSPHFPLQHFCCAKTPQDFSTRENQMMTRKRVAGILAYFKAR